MMRVFLEHILFGPSGLATVGVPLQIRGQSRLLFAKLGCLLSDGDGLRMGLDWKGAASLHPCFKHSNVLKKGSDLMQHKPGYVEIQCADATAFRLWDRGELNKTVDTLAAAANRVEAGTMTKELFNELQVSAGLTFNRHGLLMSPSLR